MKLNPLWIYLGLVVLALILVAVFFPESYSWGDNFWGYGESLP